MHMMFLLHVTFLFISRIGVQLEDTLGKMDETVDFLIMEFNANIIQVSPTDNRAIIIISLNSSINLFVSLCIILISSTQ